MSKPTPSSSLVQTIAAAVTGGGLLGSVLCGGLVACSSAPAASKPDSVAGSAPTAVTVKGQPLSPEQQAEVARVEAAAKAGSTGAKSKPQVTLPPGMKIPDDHEISAPGAEEAPTVMRGQQKRPAPQPVKEPAPAPDAAKEPEAAKTPEATKAPTMLPPLLVLPDAQAIVDRAMNQAKDIKTIEVVTCTTMVGVPENRQPAGVGKSRRVQLRFTQNDSASIPMMRVAELVDGKPGEAFIYDGRRAVLVNDQAKNYFDAGTDWFRIGSRAFPALPTWFVATRAKSFLGPRDNANAGLEPVIVGARVLRQETFDGVACDVVELLKSRDLYNPDIGNGQGAVTDVVYTIETIHYGKADGWPRKVVVQSVTEGTPGAEVSTSTYTGLKVNGDFDQSTFATKGPEGYTPRERP